MQIQVIQNFAGCYTSAYSGHVAAVRQSEPSIHVLGPLTQDNIVNMSQRLIRIWIETARWVFVLVQYNGC
jgi:hypothetical protein